MSSTSASLHRAPVSKRRSTRGSACSARWSSTMRRARAPQAMVVTCISLRVSVPVLSKQTTLAAASVSTASSRRISTLRRRMSSMPSARMVVATVGKPSGTAATASDRADRNIWNRAKPRSQPMPKTRPLTPAASHTICPPRASSCLLHGRLRRNSRPNQTLDAPDLGAQPCRDHDGPAGAPRDDRASVDHVEPITERDACSGRWVRLSLSQAGSHR